MSDNLGKGILVEREHALTYNKLKVYLNEYGELPEPDLFFGWLAQDHLGKDNNYYKDK